jgi:site-specific recombinase XerD
MATSAFFSPARPTILRRLHDGPLGPYIDEYAGRLVEQGLGRSTGKRTLRLIADLSRWLERKGLGIDELNEATLQQYRQFRARTKPMGFGDPVALRRFLGSMRERDICVTPPSGPLSPRAQVQEDFNRYLSQDIDLSARTLEHYADLLDPFLREQVGPDGPHWSRLTSTEVVGLFRRCARRRSPQYLQRLHTAMRSFLRYLQYRGEIHTDLSGCIPRVTRWRLANLPKYLSPTQVQRVLDGCDRTTAVGKRDYAILLLLARLGLRANEVTTLGLDDIDWPAGQLRLQGKGAQQVVMPLPSEVGRAIADYLQHGRPRSQSRRVFLRRYAPLIGFAKSSCISAVVRIAFERACVDAPSKGAHVLRHTLVTQMLRNGASLRQIGHLLRHRRSDTTLIYAKVDLPTLRSVALPWPEGTR